MSDREFEFSTNQQGRYTHMANCHLPIRVHHHQSIHHPYQKLLRVATVLSTLGSTYFHLRQQSVGIIFVVYKMKIFKSLLNLPLAALLVAVCKINAFHVHPATVAVKRQEQQHQRPKSLALRSTVGQKFFDPVTPARIEGNTLRTCQIEDSQNFFALSLSTEGRPLHATAELWHTPTYVPLTIKIYLENGLLRPFNCLFTCPLTNNAISVRNTHPLEFPLTARVDTNNQASTDFNALGQKVAESGVGDVIQGGALKSYVIDPSAEKVLVHLRTDAYCKVAGVIEITQGPNNKKQYIDFYGSDGKKRPLFFVLDAPGAGNMLRIINHATMEFQFIASVQPYYG